MRHIDWGLGILTPRAFDGFPDGQPLDLALVYQELLEHRELAAFEVPNRFYEIGSPEGLRETDEYLRRAELQLRPKAGLKGSKGGRP